MLVNLCKLILQHIKEYCEEAAIHGPQHIVSQRLSIIERITWFFIFIGGVGYGYLLYTPYLDKWFYSPVYMAVDSSGFDVAQIPFPAITICSNNKIVERQLESVLLTQPWKGLTKRDPKFSGNFKKALTAIVMARENPPMLDNLDYETVTVLNNYQDSLPEVLKRVMLTCNDMILECYWFGKKYDDCTDLFDVRYTDNGYCCTFNTLPMSEQFVKGAELNVGQKNLYVDPCQAWLDLINKKLTSPNYPDVFDPNTVCKWNLTTNKGYYISLDFERISFHRDYDGDYIKIYDVDDVKKSKLIATLNGPHYGPHPDFSTSRWQKKIISSSSNNMLVEFKSDAFQEAPGFSASIHYSPLTSKECDEGLNMTMKTIQSPNYPYLYKNNLSCKWLITVSHGSHITLKFLQFDLEDGKDFLSIHNGGSGESEIVAKLTGTLNEFETSTSGNQMFVLFHTDEENIRQGYQALIMENDHCQYWLNETSGTLTSPNFDVNYFVGLGSHYEHNLNCSWILNAHQGFYINLEIVYFLLGEGDYLMVYDGPDLQSRLISKFDTNFDYNTKSISCTGNNMLVQFMTDHMHTWFGFSAKIHHRPSNPYCMVWINITSGFLNSPDYSTMNCSWVITASLGSTITIQFQEFELIDAYLTIYDGGSDIDNQLNVFSGNLPPTSLYDLCNTALDLKNGKLIVEEHLPEGTYCNWLISAQEDNGYVTLEFLHLNIFKWVLRILVYDGPDDKSMLIGELFGNPNHKLLKSISSSGRFIYIVFKKLYISNGRANFVSLIKYNKIKTDCQSWLKNSTLISPNHPNINCSWIITVKYGSYIILDFKFIELESGVDFLKIYDIDGGGRDTCYETCHTAAYKGDNYCDDLNNNCGCEWDGGDCCGSNVNTQFCTFCECLGPKNVSVLNEIMTGTHKNRKISSPRNQMFVTFETSSTISKRGFKASVLENRDSCEFWMDLKIQKLSSPYYPQNYFGDGVGCEWLITAPKGNIITLEFDHFDLCSLPWCEEHFVTLYDGVCDKTKQLQTLYYTMSNDAKWIISSSGRYMFVRFSVGFDYPSINYPSTGFSAKFHYVDCNSVSKMDIGFSACFPYGVDDGPCVFDDECKDHLFCGYKNCPASYDVDDNCCTKNELLKSPNFPIDYPKYTHKSWTLTTPVGFIINLQFHLFDTHAGDPNGHDDFLTIYDGSNDQSIQIEKLSGNLGSFDISSKGNSLFVEFEPYDNSNHKGFLATIHYVNCATVNNGDEEFCNCNTCSVNEGDCDYDHHCKSNLFCGSNNCPISLGFDSKVDCCYGKTLGEEDFCTTVTPCGEDEGDCDSHDECQTGLTCGYNNCPVTLGFDSEVDCCYACSGTCYQLSYKGDNYCDDGNNNCGCQWDGGDCCGSNVNTLFCLICECLEAGVAADMTTCQNQIAQGGLMWLIRQNWGAHVKLSRAMSDAGGEWDWAGGQAKISAGDVSWAWTIICGDDTIRTYHDEAYCLTITNDIEENEAIPPFGYLLVFDPCSSDSEGILEEKQQWVLQGMKDYVDITGMTQHAFQMMNPQTGLCIYGASTKVFLAECDQSDDTQFFFIRDQGGISRSGNLKHEESGLCIHYKTTLYVGDGYTGYNLEACNLNNDNQKFDYYENGVLRQVDSYGYQRCINLPDTGDSTKWEYEGLYRSMCYIAESSVFNRPTALCSSDGYCPFISIMGSDQWCFGTKNGDYSIVQPLEHCTGTPSERFKFLDTTGSSMKSVSKTEKKHEKIKLVKNPNHSKYSKLNAKTFEQSHEIEYEVKGRSRYERKRSLAYKNSKFPNSIQRKTSINTQGQTELRNSPLASSKFGLIVILNPNEAEYTDALKNNYIGFKTLVHTPYNFPEVDAVGMAMDKNVHASVGIRGHHSWITDAANALGLYQKKCLSRSDDMKKYKEVTLEVFAYYTRKGCILECHANIFYNKCGCLPYHYPDFSAVWNKTTNCNHTALQCISKLVVFDKYCFCPSDCESTKYDFETSTAWRTPRDTSMLIKSYSKKNMLMDNVKKEIKKLDELCITPEEKEIRIKELKQLNKSIGYGSTRIQFFWKEDTMVSYVRDQHYTIVDMLANFGGVMGCAIGMSVAAACEIIYWLTIKPVAKLMVYYNWTLSTRAKTIYNITLLKLYIALCLFSFYQFYNVYITSINRKWST